MLIDNSVGKDLFAFGRILALAWYNGTTVVALQGSLHGSIYDFLTSDDDNEFLGDKAQHTSFEFWKPLELNKHQFKGMYDTVTEVNKEDLIGVYEFFEVDYYTYESCTPFSFESTKVEYVKAMRRHLWLSIFAGESFLYMARAIKKGWNVEKACEYLQRRDFEYLFVTTCEIPLDQILYTLYVPNNCESLCDPTSPRFSMLRNVIYALTLMKPQHLGAFVSFLYGAPSLPILSEDHKWSLTYLDNNNRLIPSSTCNHHLYVNVNPTYGQVTLPLLCEKLQTSILHGQQFGPP